jgi:hypothetical protein
MHPNSMLKSEIRKGEAQRIQAARHAFCRIKKKSGEKGQCPEDSGSKTRLLQKEKIRGKKGDAQRIQAARHAVCSRVSSTLVPRI